MSSTNFRSIRICYLIHAMYRIQVYDMSYGGASMYGPGKSYNLFAGRDASVALAKVRTVLPCVSPLP